MGDDEINLADLCLMLVKHKWVIAGTTAACLLLTSLYLGNRTTTYEYTTIVEVGRYGYDTKSLVESPENALGKLKSIYLPATIRELPSQTRKATRLQDVSLKNPKHTELLQISINSSPENKQAYTQFITMVLDKLLADHNSLLEIQNQQITNQIEDLRSEIELIHINLRHTLEKTKRIETRKSILESSLVELAATEKQLEEARISLRQEFKPDTDAMSMLLLDSRISQLRRDFNNLSIELNTQIPTEFDEAEYRKLELESNLITSKETIGLLELEKQGIKPTSAILFMSRSANPKGPGKSLALALALGAGLVLGIFTALLINAIQQVRLRLDQLNQA